jgi:hypothetical protein
MSLAIVEFVPKHLEKAIDLARHIATFGQFEFEPNYIRMRITDPGKAVHLDLILTPDTMKVDKLFNFGINLQMFYKLLKTLDNDQSVEIEADESVMKINQGSHYHTLISQDIPLLRPEILDFTGPKITLPTKLFQRYIRALGNVAPAIEINYVPKSDTLFLESVNSMYRTLFSVDTGVTPNDYLTEEYRRTFMAKFLEMAINPSLSDKIELTFGESLMVGYEQKNLSVLVTVTGYTEG